MPQTQIVAAALLVQTVFGETGNIYPSFTILDSNTVRLNRAPGYANTFRFIDVVKVSDCVFEAFLPADTSTEKEQGSPTKLAQINLAALSDEYRRSFDGGKIAVTGTGNGTALCWKFPVYSMLHFDSQCARDLSFPADGSLQDTDQITHALRALQFLQTYCPPQKLRF